MESRRWHIIAGFSILFITYAVVLLNIQVFSTNYKTRAEANIVERVVEYPLRGMIYDRNGKLLASNAAVFDVMIVPKYFKIEEEDSVVLAGMLDYTMEELRYNIKKSKYYSWYKPSVLKKQLTETEYAKIQDKIIRFKGLSIQARTIRSYPHQSLANALGYVKEVSKAFLDRDTAGYYQSGDLIGKSGVEKFYEEELRGQRGVSYIMKNVKGVTKGSFEDGKFDTIPRVGATLTSSIDLDLQKYGEDLMVNKKGAVVALDPNTGEILAMISAPSYDPNQLTGEGKRVSKNYGGLSRDKNKPLFNRAMQSRYPPGSTFKTVMALIGLQKGAIDTLTTYFSCNKRLVGCHDHKTPLNVAGSIINSCNPWYYQEIRRLLDDEGKRYETSDVLRQTLDTWREEVKGYGLGVKLGVDMPYEKGGLVPSSNLYDRIYKGGGWKISTIHSISIGQGEVLAMPIQLANLGAIIANRGHYYTPHIIKDIGGEGPLQQYKVKHQVDVKPEYVDHIARAMSEVPRIGTARRAFSNDLVICGKTGTAQNPHGEDHSIFMGFAPLDKPQIAIAVYVENAGFGGTWAAPIASLMMEKYVNGEVKRPYLEKYVYNGDLIAKEEARKEKERLLKERREKQKARMKELQAKRAQQAAQQDSIRVTTSTDE
ncbi:penicillin-binding protein 2 [Flammeovirga agarivorans]|uniref:Penicillin-binding protein 2 n=1 Tax=Flammeovirga agarivorans TaxID=2726742 RepID=A0A7X8XX67_9BACT|nr:penicillin-binding protein 2 [Flammeovirga agarivorans]NLR92956.1 penicillin-binding protein 2 [Flammeovirga agarivorans]